MVGKVHVSVKAVLWLLVQNFLEYEAWFMSFKEELPGCAPTVYSDHESALRIAQQCHLEIMGLSELFSNSHYLWFEHPPTVCSVFFTWSIKCRVHIILKATVHPLYRQWTLRFTFKCALHKCVKKELQCTVQKNHTANGERLLGHFHIVYPQLSDEP